jgi:hypothetical protein
MRRCFLVGSCRQFGRRVLPVPGQEFGEPGGWMIVDPAEHVGKPRLGIDVVQLGSLRDRVKADGRRPAGPYRTLALPSFSRRRQRDSVRPGTKKIKLIAGFSRTFVIVSGLRPQCLHLVSRFVRREQE